MKLMNRAKLNLGIKREDYKMSLLHKSALVTCLSLGLLACGDDAALTVKSPLVGTYTIPIKAPQNLQNLPAVVQASELTDLSFRVKGELIEINVQNGQKVKKGHLLAKLDPTNYQLAVNDRKSKVAFAKKSVDRAKAMVEFGNMAQSILDELDANHRVLKAEYEYALLQLGYVELRAPFDGIVASVPADNFQTVAVGQNVMSMHRNDNVEVKVSLPDMILSFADQNIDKSKVSLPVSLDAYPDHVFMATYKEHTTEQTSDDKKFVLVLTMPVDKERIALQGMPGNIKLDLARLKIKRVASYKVPIESVVVPDSIPLTSGERVVWRMSDDKIVTPVTVNAHSIAGLSYLNVSGELNEGDKIVTQGMLYLSDGMQVRTITSGETTE